VGGTGSRRRSSGAASGTHDDTVLGDAVMPSVGQAPAPFDHYRDPEPRDIWAMINPSDPLA